MKSPKKDENSGSQHIPEIRRGIYAQLTIYEVEESELDTLAQGSPDSFYLTFSIFLLSVATSFLISLLTTNVSGNTFTVFVLITIIGFVVGAFLFVMWRKKRKSVPELIEKIKKRLPPEGIAETKQTD